MNRLILLAALMISFFFIAGCPGGEEMPTPSQEEASISVGGWVAEVEPSEEEEKQSLLQTALEERDTSYCLKLPASERDECILPLSNDSLSNCLQLIKYENRRGCLFYHAYETEDISICDLMSQDDKAECIEHLSPPCTFVLDAEEKGRCLAFEYQNYTYCKDEQCYLDYAFEYRESGACEMLDYAKREGCLSALENKDHCKGLEEQSYKYQCYYYYALGEDSPTHCYYINGLYNTEIAFQCFTHFAIEEDNPALCEPIAELKRWDCYREYALETGNKEGCYAIDTRAPFNREKCFKEFAYAHDDLAACNEIETEYERQICYSSLIFSAEELTMTECNSIWLPEWKDKCYQELARLEGNKIYCNYIEGAAVKENCLLMFD